MGEYLQQSGAVQTERGNKRQTSQPATFAPPTHRGLGINREAAQRFRQVATVPADALRQLADEATKRGSTRTECPPAPAGAP